MGKFFWILMAILGASLIALILNHDRGSVFGLENSQFASFIFMSVWVLLIGTAVLGRGIPFRDTLRQFVIWLAIFLVLMAGYVFRYDLQDFGSRLTAGLIPGSPISAKTANGEHEVTLIRSPNGHFEAEVIVNGQPVRFLVDTGATSIVLSAADARRIGLDLQQLSFTILTRTANGTGRAAKARIDSFDLGLIRRSNLPVLVAQPGRLGQSLLGQNFLETLASYERRGDRLMLRD